MHLVLVHGMGRTKLSMRRLASELRKAGHDVYLVGYAAALESLDRIVSRVHDTLQIATSGGGPCVAVGHSLGAVLLRLALLQAPPLSHPPQHLVMLGPPNQSPRLARRLHRWWPYRWINGEAGQRLADPNYLSQLPLPEVPYTIVAGTGGRRGRFSPFGDEPNDGLLAVSETRCRPGDVVIEVPARHTFIMNNRRVRRVIRDLLDAIGAGGQRESSGTGRS